MSTRVYRLCRVIFAFKNSLSPCSRLRWGKGSVHGRREQAEMMVVGNPDCLPVASRPKLAATRELRLLWDTQHRHQNCLIQ